jgi:hypothetical protein
MSNNLKCVESNLGIARRRYRDIESTRLNLIESDEAAAGGRADCHRISKHTAATIIQSVDVACPGSIWRLDWHENRSVHIFNGSSNLHCVVREATGVFPLDWQYWRGGGAWVDLDFLVASLHVEYFVGAVY